MRADKGECLWLFQPRLWHTREQVRDSKQDHRSLHVSLGTVRSFAGSSDWGNVDRIPGLKTRQEPGLWRRGVRMWTDLPLMRPS